MILAGRQTCLAPSGGHVKRRKQLHARSHQRMALCDPDKEFLFVDRSHSLVPYETVSINATGQDFEIRVGRPASVGWCGFGDSKRKLKKSLQTPLPPDIRAWEWQKTAVDNLVNLDSPDIVFLVQHPPLFTLGAGSSECHLNFDPSDPPLPLYRTERGGEVTFHGPGQLVLYPVLNLKRHKCDLHWYLRQLEEVAISALWEVSGLEGERIEGLTGVWFKGSKIAAIGVRAKRWVTYHGLALNVAMDLSPYSLIVPCGIADCPVGSVKNCVLREFNYSSANPMCMGDNELLQEYRVALLDGFQEVFERSCIDIEVNEVLSRERTS